jgi:uncharacterized protein YndB with AHSA1/START domain
MSVAADAHRGRSIRAATERWDAMAPTGQVTVHIDAPPERVYDLVSDVTQMGRWSPECVQCEWRDGATGPVVGARFRGANRRGLVRWSTTAEVTAAQPGREFAFVTKQRDREMTRWRYVFSPGGGGTDVTESYESVFVPGFVRVAERLFVRNREAQLDDGMRSTLERLKAAAEAGTST